MLSDRCLSVCPVYMSVGLTLVYCGQTVEWIKMSLGVEVGHGPSDIVLDGDPAPPTKGHTPNFRPMSIVDKRSPISATVKLLFLIDNN